MVFSRNARQEHETPVVKRAAECAGRGWSRLSDPQHPRLGGSPDGPSLGPGPPGTAPGRSRGHSSTCCRGSDRVARRSECVRTARGPRAAVDRVMAGKGLADGVGAAGTSAGAPRRVFRSQRIREIPSRTREEAGQCGRKQTASCWPAGRGDRTDFIRGAMGRSLMLEQKISMV